MQDTLNIAAHDHASFPAALIRAQRRARHSFFDQHVIEVPDNGYITIDEGDYDALPMTIIDRIVHTVQGRLSDEF